MPVWDRRTVFTVAFDVPLEGQAVRGRYLKSYADATAITSD